MDKRQEEILEFVKILTIEKNVIKCPRLYIKKKSSTTQFWEVYLEFTRDVTMEMITKKLSVSGDESKIYTKTGELKESAAVTVSEPTIVNKGKNIGRKNQTTALTQSIMDMKTLYNKKIRSGYSTEQPQNFVITSLDDVFEKYCGDIKIGCWRPFPEKVHDFKKFSNKIDSVFLMQRKMDGIFACFIYHPKLEELGIYKGIDCFSITRETLEGLEHIKDEIYPKIKKYPSSFFCGELYKHGWNLQKISGLVRRELPQSSLDEKKQLTFNMYDVFKIGKEEGYESRTEILSIFEDMTSVSVAEEFEVTKKNYEKIYNKFIKEGYEGAIMRNKNGIYHYSFDKQIRSYDVQKLKPRYDAEWPCVDFTEGKKGKEVGAIIFICDAGKKTFTVVPNLTYNERYKMFEDMKTVVDGQTSFEKNYKGKLYTVQYTILSTDGVPQQPKGLGFRDERTI